MSSWIPRILQRDFHSIHGYPRSSGEPVSPKYHLLAGNSLINNHLACPVIWHPLPPPVRRDCVPQLANRKTRGLGHGDAKDGEDVHAADD